MSQVKWWVPVAWPFVLFFWWDKGWGFGNPPWWTADDINRAEDRGYVWAELFR